MAADLDAIAVSDEVRRRHNSATHVYLRQRHRGLDVLGTESNVTVAADGRMIGVPARFARDLAASVETTEPALSAAGAVEPAAGALGLGLGEPLLELEPARGPERATPLSGGGFSLDPIPARLVYVRTGSDAVRLAWDLVLRLADGVHWWNLQVDAATGGVLDRSNWIDADSYEVFALNLESPDEGAPTQEADPASSASPFGWHDTNGAPGAEYTDIWGNNVLHDLFHAYGFDGAAGNFQENNYGNGGAGSDAPARGLIPSPDRELTEAVPIGRAENAASLSYALDPRGAPLRQAHRGPLAREPLIGPIRSYPSPLASSSSASSRARRAARHAGRTSDD